MRIFFSLLVLLSLFSCTNHKQESIEIKDSAVVVLQKLRATDTLNALFQIRDEKQLKEVFGSNNVSDDTLFGKEGELYPGTKLFGGSSDEIFISWSDTVNRSDISTIRLACRYDEGTDAYNLDSRWRTATGLHLGTPLNRLVEMNGRDIRFYGLGWDYSGMVSNWNKGRLSHDHILVTLGVDNMTDEQKRMYPKILGQKEFSSDNPVALNLNPVVLEIIMTKP